MSPSALEATPHALLLKSETCARHGDTTRGVLWLSVPPPCPMPSHPRKEQTMKPMHRTARVFSLGALLLVEALASVSVAQHVRRTSFIVMLTLGLLGGGVVGQATAQLRHDATQATMGPQGLVTVITTPSTQAQMGAGLDFVHAQPMKLPSVPSRSHEEARQDLIATLTSPAFL